MARNHSNWQNAVLGEPEPDVSWYKGSKKLKSKKPDKRVKIDYDLKEDINTLTISDATTDDSGEYIIEATSAAGTTSETVKVTVTSTTKKAKEETTEDTESEKVQDIAASKDKKADVSEVKGPQFEIAPEATTVDVGGSFTLKCKVSGESHSTVFLVYYNLMCTTRCALSDAAYHNRDTKWPHNITFFMLGVLTYCACYICVLGEQRHYVILTCQIS